MSKSRRGRGWYDESYRHSLAARGIKTATSKQKTRIRDIPNAQYKQMFPVSEWDKDSDGDGVRNRDDCFPFDPKRQDAIIVPKLGNMLTINRDPSVSCIHQTPACVGCYNHLLYEIYSGHKDERGTPNMIKKDWRNERDWVSLTDDAWTENIQEVAFRKNGEPRIKDRKAAKEHGYDPHVSIKRMRLMSRGEAFRDPSDIQRVKRFLEMYPDTEWWIPTRAWRNPQLQKLIEKEIMTYPNARVSASLDPTNAWRDQSQLQAIKGKWDTMYYGIDDIEVNPLGEKMTKCPKTFEGKHGACMTCGGDGSCFTPGHHVHLKKHSLRPKAKPFFDAIYKRTLEEYPEWFSQEDVRIAKQKHPEWFKEN